MTGFCSSAVRPRAVTCSPERAASIGGAREDILSVELRWFEVDRVEADRPRIGPAPVAPAMDDLERRKVEVGVFCSIC